MRMIDGVAVYAEPATWAGSGAIVVIVPGLFRRADQINAIRQLIPGWVLVDLPGHGGSAVIDAPDVERLASTIRTAIELGFPGRPVTWVGESFGGLLTLQIDTHAITIDPPLSAQHMPAACEDVRRTAEMHPFFAALAVTCFTDQDYRHLFGPGALVITGMRTEGRPKYPGCLLAEPDIQELKGRGVLIRRIADVGHLCLAEAWNICATLIVGRQAELAASKGAA
jgi:hypothetical protein